MGSGKQMCLWVGSSLWRALAGAGKTSWRLVCGETHSGAEENELESRNRGRKCIRSKKRQKETIKQTHRETPLLPSWSQLLSDVDCCQSFSVPCLRRERISSQSSSCAFSSASFFVSPVPSGCCPSLKVYLSRSTVSFSAWLRLWCAVGCFQSCFQSYQLSLAQGISLPPMGVTPTASPLSTDTLAFMPNSLLQNGFWKWNLATVFALNLSQ